MRLQDELEDFFTIGVEDGDENFLSHRKNPVNHWPYLSIITRGYLAAAATSFFSEGGFALVVIFWCHQMKNESSYCRSLYLPTCFCGNSFSLVLQFVMTKPLPMIQFQQRI